MAALNHMKSAVILFFIFCCGSLAYGQEIEKSTENSQKSALPNAASMTTSNSLNGQTTGAQRDVMDIFKSTPAQPKLKFPASLKTVDAGEKIGISPSTPPPKKVSLSSRGSGDSREIDSISILGLFKQARPPNSKNRNVTDLGETNGRYESKIDGETWNIMTSTEPNPKKQDLSEVIDDIRSSLTSTDQNLNTNSHIENRIDDKRKNVTSTEPNSKKQDHSEETDDIRRTVTSTDQNLNTNGHIENRIDDTRTILTSIERKSKKHGETANQGGNTSSLKPDWNYTDVELLDGFLEGNLTGVTHLAEHRTNGEDHPNEDDGRNATDQPHNNLCATCLCDAKQENVYCKHEHLYGGKSHGLRLTRDLLPLRAVTLVIQGFERVVVTPGTFAHDTLTLQNIHFQDIREMELTNGSLHFSPMASTNLEVVVQFTNCRIPELPTTTLVQYAQTHNHRKEVNLERTRFLSLYIDRSNISTIQTRALYQARLLYFSMTRTKIDRIEEKGIDIDIYEEWLVERSTLPQLVTGAICLRAHKVVIFSQNNMIGLANRSLEILSSNQVLFEYNYVYRLGSGALLGIKPDRDVRGSNIVFLNNTVAKAENGSLAISDKYPTHERKIVDNRFDIHCDCAVKGKFTELLVVSRGGEMVHYSQTTLDVILATSRCQKIKGVAAYMRINDYLNSECSKLPIPMIVSVVTVLVVVIITVVVCMVCNHRAKRAREEANYLGRCCYSQSFSTLHSNPGALSPVPLFHSCERSDASGVQSQQPWVVAFPEVKTYKETELQMDFEQTESLRDSVRASFAAENGPVVDLLRRNQMRASCPFN